MYNFSYSVRILKEEIQEFLDGICEGIPRPDAKLVFDLVYGILRSGSTKVSMISRALGEARRLDSTEHRLTRAIESRDVSAVRDALAAYSVDVSDSFLALDESDIQKPYGKAFEWLDDVQDGSEDGRPVGKGYHVIGLAAIGSRKAVFPIALHVYSAKADGFESQQKETEKVLPDAEGRTLSMDRGYDGTIWMGVAGKAKMDWTIRAKSNRKYGVLSMKSGKGDTEGGQGKVCLPFPRSGKEGGRPGQGDRAEGQPSRSSRRHMAGDRVLPRRGRGKMLPYIARLLHQGGMPEGAQMLQAALAHRGVLPLRKGHLRHGRVHGKEHQRGELDHDRGLHRGGVPFDHVCIEVEGMARMQGSLSELRAPYARRGNQPGQRPYPDRTLSSGIWRHGTARPFLWEDEAKRKRQNGMPEVRADASVLKTEFGCFHDFAICQNLQTQYRQILTM